MAHDDGISHRVLAAQRDVFRIACDPLRHGWTLKRIAGAAGIAFSTLRGYAAGETMMPLCALNRLVGVLPAELLTLLLPPGFVLAVEEGVDHDAFAGECLGFASAHAAATHPASDAGRAISAAEADELARKRAAMGK